MRPKQGGAKRGKFAAAGGGVAPGMAGKAVRGRGPRRGGAGRPWALRAAVGDRRREIVDERSVTLAGGGDRRSAGR